MNTKTFRCRFSGLALGAVLVLCNAPLAAQEGKTAPDLGRLFTTPQQRQRIDQPGKASAAEPAAGEAGRVDGVMRRSEGRTVVWVDGVPRLEGKHTLPVLSVSPLKGQK